MDMMDGWMCFNYFFIKCYFRKMAGLKNSVKNLYCELLLFKFGVMRGSSFVILSMIWFIVISCVVAGQKSDEQSGNHPEEAINYFDCERYNYFPDKECPTLTKEDTVAVKKYLYKIVGDSTFNIAYIPRVKPSMKIYIDTAWFDSAQLGLMKGYKSLLEEYLVYLPNVQTVVIGTVITKNLAFDTTKCFHFKVSYAVRVDEVLFSTFKVNKGNILIVNSPYRGYMGGCRPDSPYNKVYVTHTKHYQQDEQNIFVLGRNSYQLYFMRRVHGKRKGHPYYMTDDKYCPDAFTNSIGGDDFDIKNTALVNDLREYLSKRKF